jgi:hypothetical protein
MLDFQWTRIPPTAPGEYWWRGGENDRPVRLRITEGMLERMPLVGEWWRPTRSLVIEESYAVSMAPLSDCAALSAAHA